MSVVQKIWLSVALTLCLTVGVLAAWQQEWLGGWLSAPATAEAKEKSKTDSPPAPAPVPDDLEGNMEPFPQTAGGTDPILQEDPYRAGRERKNTERYLESLKTAEGRVVGSFQTSLAGHSASGRVKNIELACQKLNGTVLLPGEQLSFNKVLGDSNDPSAGWQLATVIVGQEFVDGYGGGICQVSTTLYNSVLRAGLQIDERHTHSLPVGYVQPGQDATVSYPELDFKFSNSADTPIRVETQVVGDNVVSQLVALPLP